MTTSVPRTARAGEPARLTILIDPQKKKAFDALCASQDLTVSQVVRKLIADYVTGSRGPGPDRP